MTFALEPGTAIFWPTCERFALSSSSSFKYKLLKMSRIAVKKIGCEVEQTLLDRDTRADD